MKDDRTQPSVDANATASSPNSGCAITPDRGDVTTVRAAGRVKLQKDNEAEVLQLHAPAQGMDGIADLPAK